MNYQVVNQLNETQISELVELYKHEFWSKNRTYQGVTKMLAASDVIIALINEEKELIAFCRVLTDFVYRGVLYDVIVKPSCRNMGFGAKLLDEVVNHSQLKAVENLALFCLPEMIPFYERWGFIYDVNALKIMHQYDSVMGGIEP